MRRHDRRRGSDVGDQAHRGQVGERIRQEVDGGRRARMNLGAATDARMRAGAGIVAVAWGVAATGGRRGRHGVAAGKCPLGVCRSGRASVVTATGSGQRASGTFGGRFVAGGFGVVTAKRPTEPTTWRAAKQATDQEQMQQPAKHGNGTREVGAPKTQEGRIVFGPCGSMSSEL